MKMDANEDHENLVNYWIFWDQVHNIWLISQQACNVVEF